MSSNVESVADSTSQEPCNLFTTIKSETTI